jgi:outer membrane lipoprotein-sorting protein
MPPCISTTWTPAGPLPRQKSDIFPHGKGGVMKMNRLFFLVLVLIPALGLPAQVDEADTIRLKMIEALGGAKALEAIRDTTIVSTVQLPALNNMSGTTMIYQKEPDKMRMDMEIMGMKIVQASDGHTCWGINPQTGKTEEMSEKLAKEFKRGTYGNDALLNPAKFGMTYAYKGKETVDGKACHVIEITYEDGYKATSYVDAATNLTIRTKGLTLNQMEVEVEGETIIGDYKKVGNIMVAHSITNKQGGQVWVQITISEVTFNSGLEDSLFQMGQ